MSSIEEISSQVMSDGIDAKKKGTSSNSKKSNNSPSNSILLRDLENMNNNNDEHLEHMNNFSEKSKHSSKKKTRSLRSFSPKSEKSYSSSSKSSLSSWGGKSPKKKISQEQIITKKQELLFELDRLEKRGKCYFKKLTLSSSLDDIQMAFDKLQLDDELEDNVDVMREWLITIVNIFEKMVMSNIFRKWSPIKLNLKGWSQAVNSNIHRFDKPFKDLYVKWRTRSPMPPELRILGLLFGSAVMYHLANSTLTQIPGLDQMVKDNPDLLSNFMSFMQQQPNSEEKNDDTGTTTNNNGSGLFGNIFNSMKKQANPENFHDESAKKKQMNGPTSVDDILNEINNQNTDTKDNSDDISEMPEDVQSVYSNSQTHAKKPKRIVKQNS